MFEWLEKEIIAIKTPRFHIIDGPADPQLREAIETTPLQLSESYKAFVLKFGNAKLYRHAGSSSYCIAVFAGPRRRISNDGNEDYQIGFYDDANAYIRPSLGLLATGETPIFEAHDGVLRKVADGFEEWLCKRCDTARRKFGKSGWQQILNGPKPFTADEQSIANARRSFHWRFVGINSNGDHLIEIRNDSDRILPFFTLGVRSKDRHLNGGHYLRVENLTPGQTEVLTVDCYKDLVAPEQIELFDLPDPGPEDREYYWEFRK